MTPIIRLSLALALVAGCKAASEGRPAPAAAATPDAPARNAPEAATSRDRREPDVAERGEDLFSEMAPLSLTVALDAEARASLDRSPRKWTRATVTIGGQTLENVGIKLKGHRSMQALDEKPAFVLAFDRFAPGRTAFGLRRLVVNNQVDDPTALREPLAYEFFREIGVPAPRTRYARVQMADNDRATYLLVEAVDEVFLTRWFTDATGNLYEGEYGCDVRPEDVWGFDLDGGTDVSRAALHAFAQAVKAGAGLDRLAPSAVRFLAAVALLGDFDGYWHSHNYYLYHEPSTQRWSFIPWGQDRSLYRALDVFGSGGLLAERCQADAACRLSYVRALREVADRFERLDLAARADTLIAALGDLDVGPKGERKRHQMRRFIAERPGQVRALTACLEGDGEADPDGDGHGCLDCAPDDPTVHPGAVDVCGDGLDQDCSGVADDAPACGCPTEVVDGVTFSFCDQKRRWADAAAHCLAMGHRLARLDGPEQSRAVWEASRRVSKARWWIGLSDTLTEGVYRWADGTPLERDHWKRGDPDDDHCGEDCVALTKRGKGRWYDTHCGLKRPFICRHEGDGS